jgi:hypothetical protein
VRPKEDQCLFVGPPTLALWWLVRDKMVNNNEKAMLP